MTPIPFKDTLKKDMQNPEFIREYELIKARNAAKLTQQQLAEKMGTSQAQLCALKPAKERYPACAVTPERQAER